jgi:glucokinase
MTPSCFIGVDLGGTNIRAARFTRQSHIPEAKTKRPTRAAGGPDLVFQRLEETIREVAPEDWSKVAGVGIAIPGPTDPYQGIVMKAPNLPGWINIPLKQIMEKRLGRPVFLGNDANLAALGEWKFGAGQGHQDVLYLTISTGIGGGMISGGRLLLGAQGLAAEVGHLLVDPSGPKCGCGQHGHFEALASGTAITQTARARLREGQGTASKVMELVAGKLDQVTSAVVGQAALAGDEFARGLITEAGEHIGRALASLLHAYNPSIVIFGGGVSMLGDLLLAPARVKLRQYAMSDAYWDNCPLVLAALGDDAGLVGAGALVMEETAP